MRAKMIKTKYATFELGWSGLRNMREYMIFEEKVTLTATAILLAVTLMVMVKHV
jgi:hypothetical protein